MKKVVYSLDWFKTNDRYALLGCDDCTIILYDAKEMKTSWELNPFKQSTNLKIQCVKCGPTDSTFVCSLVSKDNNKLLLYDVKTKKIEVRLILVLPSTFLISKFSLNDFNVIYSIFTETTHIGK